jgi:hypothetical protein
LRQASSPPAPLKPFSPELKPLVSAVKVPLPASVVKPLLQPFAFVVSQSETDAVSDKNSVGVM